MRLHSDTSGVTVSYGKPRGLGMILTVAAGYLTPSLLGLGGAWLLAARHITALLWASIALLALLLLLIRNFYGVLTVVLAGAAVFLASWSTNVKVAVRFRLSDDLVPAGRRGQAGARAAADAQAGGAGPASRTPTSSTASPASRPAAGSSSSCW